MTIIFSTSSHLWEKRILLCAFCGIHTVHALNKTGTKYVCGCSEEIEIIMEEEAQ